MAEAPAIQDATALTGVASMEPEDRLRADTYRLLGRLLAAAPADDTLDLIAGAPVSEEESLLGAAWRLLATSAARARAQQVEEEYFSLFVGLGRGELMPYASWYLTGFLMEQPLAKLRADLARLGFERHDGVREPEDHAAALCEVMALLAADDDEESLETQADFFETHMGPWMARFFRDLQEARSARFYRAVGQLGEQFIQTDQRYLEMVERQAPQRARPAGSGVS